MNHVNEALVELIVDRHDKNHCCISESNTNLNYELIELQNDFIIVTMKSMSPRQETLLKKATHWFHDSTNKCLTKKEFFQMLDPSNGRLLNEKLLRQRVYDSGCDESIRRIVWCYLFRVFTDTMTNDDKTQYHIKVTEQYNE